MEILKKNNKAVDKILVINDEQKRNLTNGPYIVHIVTPLRHPRNVKCSYLYTFMVPILDLRNIPVLSDGKAMAEGFISLYLDATLWNVRSR